LDFLGGMTDSKKPYTVPPALAAAAVALVAAALYLPTLGADFAWDSQIQVRYDTFIHDLRNLPAVLSLRVLGMDVIDFNRPTQLLSLMTDAALWGKHPFGYHLTSVLLHTTVTVLLFTFCRRLTSTWCAFAAAILYAVHPVNCEAVAEVGNREDVLATLFVLAGLNAAAAWGATWRSGLACVPCFFLAIGAKESAVVGPVLLALYWWWFRRPPSAVPSNPGSVSTEAKATFPGSASGYELRRTGAEPRRAWLTLIGATAIAVGAFLVARFVCEMRDSAIFATKPARLGGSWADMLLIQPRLWIFYLRQIVWPHDLCADYGPYSIRNFGLPVAVVVLGAVVVAQIWGAKRDRVFALGVATFWLSLLPVSNFIPIFQPVADRFLYLPLAGVALMLAALVARSWPSPGRSAKLNAPGNRHRSEQVLRRSIRLRFGAVVLGMLALPLAWATLQQQKIWHDDLALWRDTAKKNPGSHCAFNNLGSALISAGRKDEALVALQQSVKVTGGKNADTWAQMAILLDEKGLTAEADVAFKKAVALDARLAKPDLIVTALMWEKPRVEKWKVIAARN
jgi:hypothetical protein